MGQQAYANKAISGCVTRVARVNVSYETREANIVEGQSCHAPFLPQFHVTGGFQQPVNHNQNAKHRQRRRACRQQMQEARKIICLADTRCEAHACVSSEPDQTREVCVWIPKCRAQELTFLRLHLTDVMLSNARSTSLLRDTRPVSLR